MPVIEIQHKEDEALKVFTSLTEHQLGVKTGDEGLFIAESPKVITTALEQGYEPVSMLCERKHISGDAASIIQSNPDMPVYTGEREILKDITGYKLTRGVLCAMKRKVLPEASSICSDARRVGVLETVCDTTNIGSIFRSAAALGIDAILLTPDSCDPFNRRSIRVSMGSVFKIPWAFSENPVELLRSLGFVTLALALKEDSIPIDSPQLKGMDKLAMVLGAEGYGLTDHIISLCDYKVVIPMHHGVDSLNVGSAAAIAFWQFRI
ncbi:MAG: RNA methyltransferase [Muribaculaceae bacterium]|nr:RNA methyltransferase [Muribaculaceae bacterium]